MRSLLGNVGESGGRVSRLGFLRLAVLLGVGRSLLSQTGTEVLGELLHGSTLEEVFVVLSGLDFFKELVVETRPDILKGAVSKVGTSLEGIVELNGGGIDDGLGDEDSEDSERGGELHDDKVGDSNEVSEKRRSLCESTCDVD